MRAARKTRPSFSAYGTCFSRLARKYSGHGWGYAEHKEACPPTRGNLRFACIWKIIIAEVDWRGEKMNKIKETR